MGVPLLPPDRVVAPEGSSASYVLNESLVLSVILGIPYAETS